jgi:alpha-tubulin suppressor-like RCC1 family protein
LEASPIAAGFACSVFVDAAGGLQACKHDCVWNNSAADGIRFEPAPFGTMAGIRVRSVPAGDSHRLALSWDGRVYSWGANCSGQLGHGDRLSDGGTLTRHAPALVEGLLSVRNIAAACDFNLALTESGGVFSWGNVFRVVSGTHTAPSPIIVEGFGQVRVLRLYAAFGVVFAIGEDGRLFSWGYGPFWTLGHGDEQNQAAPKRVEALRDVRVSSVSLGLYHVFVLTEDGMVYAWGKNTANASLGNPHVLGELLPKPVEALRCLRMCSVAAGGHRS